MGAGCCRPPLTRVRVSRPLLVCVGDWLRASACICMHMRAYACMCTCMHMHAYAYVKAILAQRHSGDRFPLQSFTSLCGYGAWLVT